MSRKNYNGFYLCGDVSVSEGGKYSQMICYNCVAIGNIQLFGFGVHGAGNSMKLIGCKSFNNSNGYYAFENTKAELIYCGSSRDTTEKSAQSGATITVNNTTLVV
jgi:hypothetical protein